MCILYSSTMRQTNVQNIPKSRQKPWFYCRKYENIFKARDPNRLDNDDEIQKATAISSATA